MKRPSAISIALAAALAFMPLSHAMGETAEELRARIAQQNAQIEAINKEIAQYEAQLKQTTGKKQTLQNAIRELTLARNKITASINRTKKQIDSTQLHIQALSKDISTKEALIARDKAAIGQGLRAIDAIEDEPLAVRLISQDSLGEAWRDIDESAMVGEALGARIADLTGEKRALADARSQSEEKKTQLESERKQLSVEQGSLDATKRAQADLLAQTKSQEAAYQKLIKQKKAQEAQFEAALTDLKAKLDVAINPSQITPAGKGVLRWPVDDVIVTQYFGDTEFARNGGYKGKGHNGIDLGVPVGTPVKAALAGTVAGTGNTDAVRGCYSFGKWVLLKHGNGLATLYAHLSQTSVSSGDTVATGQLLGYSGETGYATGPHLHFGVYVGSATKIMKLGDATNTRTPCSGATMPIAPLQAYLNPMSYL